ncbi:MAG: hypothetical protein Q8P10_02950 [bacterium]|nr:hypothetical protein [bacterium]
MAYVLRKYTLLIIITLLLLLSSTSNFLYAQTETLTPSPTSLTPTFTPTPTPDNTNQDRGNELVDQIKELESKLGDLQKQEKTLSSQIAVMDSQMRLTQLRISVIKEEIQTLTEDIGKTTKKISNLEASLTSLTKILLNRIIVTYQVGSVQSFQLLLVSNGVSDFFTRANYLKIVQAHDKQLIYETQQAKNDYTNQKQIFESKKKKVEDLQKQLESYTAELDREKVVKQQFLAATKNDEAKYQDLLAKARSEYEAIQGIISGKGTETQVRNVSEGERIASVISGSSCNSGGAHLHFMVARDGNTENPFNYLKNVDFQNCSGSSCGSSDGDAFNPSGSWNWPLDPQIKMNQGYGSTWATKYTWVSQIYSSHNGIDIEGSSLAVKSVKAGTLFQGSYTGYNGCRLRYVRVHNQDGLDTFYLHINYIF